MTIILTCIAVDVFFCEPEVDDVENVLLSGRVPPDQEVLRLHVSVDEVFRVHVFNAADLQDNFRISKILYIVENELLTNCMAIMETVFREKCLSHMSKRSSREWPSSSITNALYLPHGPK